MHRPPARPATLLALAALGLLAACDGDPADLARELNDARAGCTEEKLRAADEECIRMFERYGQMGTEAMQGYIGAVKSLDRALERMPPAQFDTAGLGHAITVPLPGGAEPVSRNMADDGRWERAPRREWTDERRYDDRGAYPPSGRYDEEYRYGDGYRYDDEYENEPYDPAYGYGRDDEYGDPYGRYAPPGDPGLDERIRYDPRYDLRYDSRAGRVPEAARRDAVYQGDGRWPREPRRGRLLPPDQRLRRPWLDEAETRGYRAPPPERYHPSIHPDSGGRPGPAPRVRPR